MPDRDGRRGARVHVVRGAALLSLAILLAHAWTYRFLTDDAFISFRYARNLAEGHGLVFNPGHERVEGYTNFLWVLLLAAFDRLGLAPERVANALSIACGVGVWLLVLRAAAGARLRAPGDNAASGAPLWIALAPVFLLAATRSFAVWCTSGLETKLFELLVVAAVLRAISEVEAARAGGRETWALSALLLALACLTRPDGAVVAGGLLGARWLLERRRGGARARDVAPGVALFATILLAHLAFRLAYYGDWVPNTYHAKVGGRTWLSMGGLYLASFAIEYGVLFWAPLLAAAGIAAGRGAAPAPRPALVAGALVPFVAYVAAVGGDHFEFRPIDVVFPLAYLLLADGAAALAARGRAGRAAAAALLALTLANAVAVPLLGHLAFPADYRPGFPGSSARADGTRDLVSRDRLPSLFGVPLVGAALETYNALIRETTAHAVGIRQEEHRLFLPTVADDGKTLARLVTEGRLRPDAHVAIGAVGAIPYYSGLRTLDRMGLTDRVVAKGPSRAPGARLMAHDKIASMAHAESAGVDLWAADNTHLVFGPDEPRLREFAQRERELGAPLVAATAGPDRFLLAHAVGGPARAAARLPHLVDAARYFEEEAARPGAPWWFAANLGDILAARGDTTGAVAAFERALRANPGATRAEHHLGTLLLAAGDARAAAAHLRRAIALDATIPRIRFDLGLALVENGEIAEAFRFLREGAEAAPADLAMSSVLARFLATCPDRSLRDGPGAVRIAERLRRFTRGRDARVLDTLASAYASVGRFDDARRAAEQAIAIARSRGDDVMADEIRARADLYAAGRVWF